MLILPRYPASQLFLHSNEHEEVHRSKIRLIARVLELLDVLGSELVHDYGDFLLYNSCVWGQHRNSFVAASPLLDPRENRFFYLLSFLG
jgi:hypothetical protein